MQKNDAPADSGASPSQLIDAKIKALGDWRGETLARVRRLILQADPEVIEEDALKALIRAAATLNAARPPKKSKSA